MNEQTGFKNDAPGKPPLTMAESLLPEIKNTLDRAVGHVIRDLSWMDGLIGGTLDERFFVSLAPDDGGIAIYPFNHEPLHYFVGEDDFVEMSTDPYDPNRNKEAADYLRTIADKMERVGSDD